MSFKIRAAFATSVGKVRKKNEDNLFFNGLFLPADHKDLTEALPERTDLKARNAVFSVFDGMGGEKMGEIASFLAAETMSQKGTALMTALDTPADPALLELYAEMNLRVCDESARLPEGLMGSTGVTLVFSGKTAFCCNAGDSPAFRIHKGEIRKISVDHVESLPAGVKRKPRLIQYFGLFPEDTRLEPSLSRFALEKGDFYLLCSDGLTDLVTAEEVLKTVLRYGLFLKKAVKKLLEKALNAGGKDNVTLILCRVDG